MKILFKLNPYLQQRQREKIRWIFPIKLAMYATHLRDQGHRIVWDGEIDDSFDKVIFSEDQIDVPFLHLPAADRILTTAGNEKWQGNGNFKYHPGTYIQAADGCWWGKCEFCVEKKNTWQVRSVEIVVDELKECNKLGFKEVFDDSGTFPTGRWLDSFIETYGRIPKEKRCVLGCNMRLVDVDYRAMADIGFRMVLFGVESSNQITLDKINKGVKCEDIKYLKKAEEAGLEPHIAVIFGWPWETDEDALSTLKLVHELLRKGIAKTAQASFIVQQGIEGNEGQRRFVRDIYKVAYSSEFLFSQLKDIKDWNDVKYLWRKILANIQK